MTRPTRPSVPPSADVETWFASLDHPLKTEILTLRQILLDV